MVSLQVAAVSAKRVSCIELTNRGNKRKTSRPGAFCMATKRCYSNLCRSDCSRHSLLIIFIILKSSCRFFRAYRSKVCSFIHGTIFWIFQQFVNTSCDVGMSSRSLGARIEHTFLTFIDLAAGCFVSYFKSLNSRAEIFFTGELSI